MKRIFKYPIDDGLTLPRGANVLSVGIQGFLPYVWAEVDTDEAQRDKCIVLPTGGTVQPEHEHLGTWQEPPLVWHLYRWRPA